MVMEVRVHKPWYIKALMWSIGVGFVAIFALELL